MKPIFYILLMTIFYQTVLACPFENQSLGDIAGEEKLLVSEPSTVAFPEGLFKSYEKHIGRFSKIDCKDAIVSVKIIDKVTREVFTAFYTNDGNCDGDNSFGVIVSGLVPDPEHAVALIQDSELICL